MTEPRAEGAHPHAPTGIFLDGPNFRALARKGHFLQLGRPRTQDGQVLACAHIKTLGGAAERQHPRRFGASPQGTGRIGVLDPQGRAVKKLEREVGAEPKPAFFARQDRFDRRQSSSPRTRAGPDAGFASEAGYTQGGAVEQQQTAAAGDEKTPFTVFGKAADLVVGPGLGTFRAHFEGPEAMAIVAIETIEGPHPQKTLVVGFEGDHRILGEPLVERELAEPKLLAGNPAANSQKDGQAEKGGVNPAGRKHRHLLRGPHRRLGAFENPVDLFGVPCGLQSSFANPRRVAEQRGHLRQESERLVPFGAAPIGALAEDSRVVEVVAELVEEWGRFVRPGTAQDL